MGIGIVDEEGKFQKMLDLLRKVLIVLLYYVCLFRVQFMWIISKQSFYLFYWLAESLKFDLGGFNGYELGFFGVRKRLESVWIGWKLNIEMTNILFFKGALKM